MLACTSSSSDENSSEYKAKDLQYVLQHTLSNSACIYYNICCSAHTGLMLSCLGTATDLLDITRQMTWQDCIG